MGSIVIGAIAGTAIDQVWNILKTLAGARSEFQEQYKRLELLWGRLRPLLDKQTSTESEADALRCEIERGGKLLSKYAKVSSWNVLKRANYSNRLKELADAIQGFILTETLREVQGLRSMMKEMEVEGLRSMMKEINSKLDEFLGGGEEGGIRLGGSVAALPPLPRKVFGMEKPLSKVKRKLRRQRVVGVCGMGGCGKTTLANLLCRDPDIKAEYGEPIFQPVSSSPDVEKICRRLLEKFNKHAGTFSNRGDAINELASYLSGRTEDMLIVLDDVWSVDKDMRMLVDAIKKAAHSKILITSRAKLKVCDSSHSMSLLSKDNARKLFELHALHGDRERSWKPDKQLIDQIVKSCRFHPLALLVIGSALVKEGETVWHETANGLKRNGGNLKRRPGDEIIKLLCTSLTVSLKERERECFLDFGSFPEGHTVPATVIIDMWTETRNLNENEAYEILLELGRRNLVKLIERKRDPDRSFSSLSITQHDLLRELAIKNSKMEGHSQIVRLIVENRESKVPKSWMLRKSRTSNAKLVSINTGDMKKSDWPYLSLPNAEVLNLNFSATFYCLPRFLQRMKNLKVLLLANHGSNRAEISGLSFLTSLKKLKRVMFRKISFPLEPPQMVEERTVSRLLKFVRNVTPITVDSSADQPPQELHRLSLVLCDVHHMLHVSSLFPLVRDLEIDCCTGLIGLPGAIRGISCIEKLSITNLPDLLKLPDSIGELRKLKVLRLHRCERLKRLPHSLSQLSELRLLDISYCYNLDAFPEGMENLGCLEKIDMRSCLNITHLPPLVQNVCLMKVVCDEEAVSLWTSCGLDPCKLDVRKEEISLDFLRGEFEYSSL